MPEPSFEPTMQSPGFGVKIPLRMNKSVILAILIVFCLLGLTGCGQKGPLYLPQTSQNTTPPPDETEQGQREEDTDDAAQ